MAKRGRKRKNFEFEEARDLVRRESLSSLVDYKKWYAFNRPSRLPKRPDRAYKMDWKGWSDFLGTNNPFPCVKRSYRPYREARAFAHSLRFSNRQQWLDYCRSGKKPKDVPARPDIVYQKSKEWFTWREFLGYNVAERIVSNVESNHIMFILKAPNRPSNVFNIGSTNGGTSAVFHIQNEYKYQIVAMFAHDGKFDINSFITRFAAPFWDGNQGEYVVFNLAELMNALSEQLNQVHI